MLPLSGIRIVEAAQMISAPLAVSILADQGADVIKIEPNNGKGDRMRHLGDQRNGIGTLFAQCNRGKRSIALNTKDPDGLEVLRSLIGEADVFVQNFRPGAIDRMGVGADEMCAADPRLIYVSVSGFGPSGPYADQMVFDYVIQGVSGMAMFEGAGADPLLIKNLVVDKVTSLTVAQAISTALFQRERTGKGQHLEVNMLDAGLQFFWPDGMWNDTLIGDDVTVTPTLAANYRPQQVKDGWITMSLATATGWPGLAAAIDPALVDDPRFAEYEDRQTNAAELRQTVDAIFAELTMDEALARLRAHDLPGGPVLPMSEVHRNPQVEHNRIVIEHDTHSVGRLREVRPAAHFEGRLDDPAGPVPLFGEHTDEILAEIGHAPEAIAGLRDRNIVA